MAVPKKNHSHMRQHKRRANWKGKLVELTACNNCGELKRPHHVCDACGFYNGKQYKEVEAAEV